MKQGKPVNVTDADFENEVLKSDLPAVVDYWAPWCGPCKMAEPVLEKIAGEFEGKLKICRINVDEQRHVAINYGIMSIPTLHIFKDGQVVDQITGITPNFEADLKKKIEFHLG